jgi:hypothetical protein
MTVLEYSVQWTGGRIGTGFTNFHVVEFADAEVNTLGPAIRTWFNAIKGTVASNVTWTFPAEVRKYDTETGTLLEALPVTPEASLAASGSGSYNAAAGRLVRWQTGSIVAGRRLIGRTFIVPTSNTGFGTNGEVSSSTISTDNTAHGVLLGALNSGDFKGLAVWSKTAGVARRINSGATLQKATVLRSRND